MSQRHSGGTHGTALQGGGSQGALGCVLTWVLCGGLTPCCVQWLAAQHQYGTALCVLSMQLGSALCWQVAAVTTTPSPSHHLGSWGLLLHWLRLGGASAGLQVVPLSGVGNGCVDTSCHAARARVCWHVSASSSHSCRTRECCIWCECSLHEFVWVCAG